MEPLLVFGPWSSRYDLGPSHPLTPRRFGPGIDLIRAMAEATGSGPIRELEPAPATDEELGWVHRRPYIEVVRRASEAPMGAWEAGLGPGDTPAFPGMHEASAAVAGGSLRAMEKILAGDIEHAFHPGGGLHHAMPDRASGFCVYDDPALAIARARRDGRRVLYVDLDVHHGDGVQQIHWDDPGVLTLSIHQSGRTLFPGSGFVGELGEGAAAGTSLNVPLDPATGERGWLAALRAVLPEVAAAFGPDVVVSQHGADAHAWDPLANLRVTTTAMGEAARLIDAIAHRWAGGRWLATGGGGYDAYRVVPRAWSHVWLAAAHVAEPPPIPEAWRRRWAAEAERYGQSPLPSSLDDEPNAGLRVDATQEAADARAAQIADLVRELAVPRLLSLAGAAGWWHAVDDLAPGARREDGAAADVSGDPAPTIVEDMDAAAWSRLGLAPRTIPPADPAAGHALVLGALTGSIATRVSAAVAGSTVVGLALSVQAADDAGLPGHALLALGVAPAHRGKGLGRELLRRHVASAREGMWSAIVTLADRDPVDPLPVATRAAIARRLLEGAGFSVERAGGQVGQADPTAIVARR